MARWQIYHQITQYRLMHALDNCDQVITPSLGVHDSFWPTWIFFFYQVKTLFPHATVARSRMATATLFVVTSAELPVEAFWEWRVLPRRRRCRWRRIKISLNSPLSVSTRSCRSRRQTTRTTRWLLAPLPAVALLCQLRDVLIQGATLQRADPRYWLVVATGKDRKWAQDPRPHCRSSVELARRGLGPAVDCWRKENGEGRSRQDGQSPRCY